MNTCVLNFTVVCEGQWVALNSSRLGPGALVKSLQAGVRVSNSLSVLPFAAGACVQNTPILRSSSLAVFLPHHAGDYPGSRAAGGLFRRACFMPGDTARSVTCFQYRHHMSQI